MSSSPPLLLVLCSVNILCLSFIQCSEIVQFLHYCSTECANAVLGFSGQAAVQSLWQFCGCFRFSKYVSLCLLLNRQRFCCLCFVINLSLNSLLAAIMCLAAVVVAVNRYGDNCNTTVNITTFFYFQPCIMAKKFWHWLTTVM